MRDPNRPKIVQWSKIQSRIKDLITPELRSRVGFYITRYRKRLSHHEVGRAWITIDGVQILEASHYVWMHAYDSASEEAHRLFPKEEASYLTSQAGYQINTSTERATDLLAERAIHEPSHLYIAFHEYPSLPLADAILSSNPLVRALTMLDRRVGQRTLSRIKPKENDHPLIRRFYELRVSNGHHNNNKKCFPDLSSYIP